MPKAKKNKKRPQVKTTVRKKKKAAKAGKQPNPRDEASRAAESKRDKATYKQRRQEDLVNLAKERFAEFTSSIATWTPDKDFGREENDRPHE